MAEIHADEPTRRDFLYVATGAFAAVGAAAAVWPLIDQMNPDASVLALASAEFDLSGIPLCCLLHGHCRCVTDANIEPISDK